MAARFEFCSSQVKATVWAFIPFCRDISAANYHLTLVIFPWLENGRQFTLAVEIPCSEGRIVHCPGQKLLQLSLEKTCLAAWLSSQWVAGLREHVTLCEEIIMYWVSVLTLLQEGKLLLENIKLHFQVLTCKAIKLSRK